MQRASLEIEFVTPCFLAGADQTAHAEWRAASIRGQLRWWFRAVAGGEYVGDLRRVKAAEEEVFGSTGRRSSVRIRIPPGATAPAVVTDRLGARRPMREEDLARAWGLTPKDESWQATLRRLAVRNHEGKSVPSDPFSYLGFGCVDHRGNLARPMIPARQGATFEIVWNESAWNRIASDSQALFAKAVWAWLNLGGIGSKSRNGFGSLRCVATTGAAADLLSAAPPLSLSSLDAIRNAVEDLRRPGSSGTSRASATWSHFTASSRILVGTSRNTSWEDALSLAGAWLIAFRRRYGADYDEREYGGRSVAGRDYAWGFHHSRRSTPPREFPDRAGFGLPLPFGKRAETVVWDLENRTGTPRDRRRASPLLLHVAQVGEDFHPVWTYLPSAFLPGNGQLAFKNRTGSRGEVTAEERSIVNWFLDDLRTKNLVQEAPP